MGDYLFVTHATANVYPNPEFDTVIYCPGYIRQESKHSVEVQYAPHLISDSSIMRVDGTIHIGIEDDGTFSYPDFTAQEYHSSFSGHVSDDGTIHITFGIHGLGARFSNEITGTRR